MDDDGRMVELLAAAAQRCDGLGSLLDGMTDAVEGFGQQLEAFESAARPVDDLGATLRRLTEAVNGAVAREEATCAGATEALARAVAQSRAAAEAADAMAKQVDESAQALEDVVGGQVKSAIQAHGAALDEDLANLGPAMDSLHGALGEQRTRCAQAIGDAGQDLEKACAEHDAALRSWTNATSRLLNAMSSEAATMSIGLGRLADAHAESMIVTFNESVDDHNDVMAGGHRGFNDDIEPDLIETRRSFDSSVEDLALHATERARQFAESDQAAAEQVQALRERIAAAIVDVQATGQANQ